MSDDDLSLTYLEFYSGVGGWSYALKEAVNVLQKSLGSETSFTTKCLGAYDHSDLCNKVFNYNFPETGAEESKIDNDGSTDSSQKPSKKRKTSPGPTKPVSIESLTKKRLEELNALIWMMSPPCQPHTRQHTKQSEDIDDPRSKSFIHLCNMISKMDQNALPKVILLENVVGFGNSKSCELWRRTLKLRDYVLSHFHLNPTQCGLPNDRPRFYSMAVLLDDPTSLLLDEDFRDDYDISVCEWFCGVREADFDFPFDPPPIRTNIKPLGVNDAQDDADDLLPLSHFLDPEEKEGELFVADKLLKSNSSWCFDIVTPSDKRSACFTSSYGKFVRGTGSIIYDCDKGNVAENSKEARALDKFRLVPPEQRQFDSSWASGLDLSGKLRYFSGKEIARLFGFPVSSTTNEPKETFRFPPECSLKQQWKLMGNSLNVRVASKICEASLRLLHFMSQGKKWKMSSK